jgi:hypothetical protein
MTITAVRGEAAVIAVIAPGPALAGLGADAMVRTWAFVLVLLGTCCMTGAAPAAQSDD